MKTRHRRKDASARSGRRLLLSVVAALTLGTAGTGPAAAKTLIYPRPDGAADNRSDYAVALLRLALQSTGTAPQLAPSTMPMTQRRAIVELAQGQDIDVLWTMTSREREQRLRAVRIPLARGLAGWRVLLIREGDQPQFNTIDSLKGLAALRGGQAKDWPDTRILRGNGLNVYAAPSYRGLFDMLQYGHIDYFPRTVREAQIELAAHPGAGLALEQHLVLHYPTAFYFFVAPNNGALARRIKAGLQAAIADGSFERLFQRYFGKALEAANLKRRRVLKLDNPVEPDDLPAADSPLWSHPISGR